MGKYWFIFCILWVGLALFTDAASAGVVSIGGAEPGRPLVRWQAITGTPYVLEAAPALGAEAFWQPVASLVATHTNLHAPDLPFTSGATSRFWRVTQQAAEGIGWTDPARFLAPDSRLVYVATTGNDALAAQVHDRGYYLPGDPEIGPDPTQPVDAIQPFASMAGAKAYLRGTNPAPDWLLFHRGDVFEAGSSPLVERREAGRSADQRRVYTAYGPVTEPRPILLGLPEAWIFTWEGGNYMVSSIEFACPPCTGGVAQAQSRALYLQYLASGILIEDTAFPPSTTSTIQLGAHDITLRRCVVYGNWDSSNHVQGLFIASATNIVIEECVFDLNGYKENPLDPATWTSDIRHESPWPAGSGLQPLRTFLDRNIYAASCRNLRLDGNIIARGGGGGSVQMRVGGTARRNVFLWNESALVIGHAQADRNQLEDAIVYQNLVLHDDHMLPPGGFGHGVGVGVGLTQTGLLSDNLVLHFHRIDNNGSLLEATGLEANGTNTPATPAGFIRMNNNIAITPRHTSGMSLTGTSASNGVLGAAVLSNVIAVTTTGDPVACGDAERATGMAFDHNHYHAPAGSFLRANIPADFSAWQSANYDVAGLLHGSLTGLAASAGWANAGQLDDPEGRHGWERDIVAYLQATDPDYQPDEDVTVDAGVPVENQRTNAPLVREVLRDFRAFPHDHAPLRPPMTDEEARLAARRYHAFLVFMAQARANRKGTWHPAFTADALNNYIRCGFGKKPVDPAGHHPD